MTAIRLGVWGVGMTGWAVACGDRSFAALANGWADAVELTQIFTVLAFAFAWLILFPARVGR